MAIKKFNCPSCGADQEWPQELPDLITCGNCKTKFSPANEVRRFTLFICEHPNSESFIEKHYFATAFIVPRRGDHINSKYANLPENKTLKVVDVEHEFVDKEGSAIHQNVNVYVEVIEKSV